MVGFQGSTMDYITHRLCRTGLMGMNPRNFIPQQGKVSLRILDYCTALTGILRNGGQRTFATTLEMVMDGTGCLPSVVNSADKTTVMPPSKIHY